MAQSMISDHERDLQSALSFWSRIRQSELCGVDTPQGQVYGRPGPVYHLCRLTYDRHVPVTDISGLDESILASLLSRVGQRLIACVARRDPIGLAALDELWATATTSPEVISWEQLGTTETAARAWVRTYALGFHKQFVATGRSDIALVILSLPGYQDHQWFEVLGEPATRQLTTTLIDWIGQRYQWLLRSDLDPTEAFGQADRLVHYLIRRRDYEAKLEQRSHRHLDGPVSRIYREISRYADLELLLRRRRYYRQLLNPTE